MIEAAKVVQPKIAKHRSPIRRQFWLKQQISRQLEEVRLEKGSVLHAWVLSSEQETIVASPHGFEAAVFSSTLGLSLFDDVYTFGSYETSICAYGHCHS
jgi:hypothetical protein